MSNFTDYREHVGSNPDKFYKTTLHESDRMMLGLNRLEPGQVQSVHRRSGQDKFFFVVEGEGEFSVGGQTDRAGAGVVVWAPAGVDHCEGKTPLARAVESGREAVAEELRRKGAAG